MVQVFTGITAYETMANTLVDMGFMPTKGDPDMWYRDKGDHYEYLCVHVDDLLLIVPRNPQAFYDTLINKYKYILKGVCLLYTSPSPRDS